MASDPTVLKVGSTYHLYHTCFATEATSVSGVTSAICHATSSDGSNWAFGSTLDTTFPGVVFRGENGAWDEEIETAHVVFEAGSYKLYHSGYTRLVSGNRAAARIGLATSADGETFTRVVSNPVLEPTPQGRDADDMFSAAVFTAAGSERMVYVGYCNAGYHDGLNCSQPDQIQLLGATRDLGGTWNKESASVLETQSEVSWLASGVAEPDMLVGPDGYYYLFMSGGLADNEPRVLGVARSATPFGPWEINPEPIVKPTGVAGAFDACGTFAPAVRLEGDLVRMWYLGIDDCAGTCTSCDFASCGCEAKFGIGYAETSWPLRSGN